MDQENQVHDAWQKLEPELLDHTDDALLKYAPDVHDCQLSTAISLKRIADALERLVGEDGAINAYTKAS